MARLRRPESFDDVRAEGLFRTTTVPQILAKRGAIFMEGLPGLLGAGGFRPEKIPTKQEVLAVGTSIFESTAQAEGVDVFLSHRWGSARWTKYLALCLYVNLTAAVVCSTATWLLATATMILFAGGAANLGGNLLLMPILVYLPMAVFFVVFFFGQHVVHRFRPLSVWVDRACIHQTDHDFKRRQIQALPVFVARSSSMLVLWDDAYFVRLWCQLELATFAKHGGAQKVQFLPLWLAPWLLSSLLLDVLVATSWYILSHTVPMDLFSSTPMFSAILGSAFGPLLTVALFNLLFGTALGVLASIPWTIACRAKLRSHSLMLEQMACFDCRAAECTVQADRILVEQQVQQLFRSALCEKDVVVLPTSSTGSEHAYWPSPSDSMDAAYMSRTTQDSVAYARSDDEALDAFNSYIRGPLRTAVMESVGDQLHVPYSMCLVASLPMIFYSTTDTLQCDAACRSASGFPSFESYLLPVALGWLGTIWLVLPIFQPVFLRMLTCAYSVQTQLLQLMLAALSGILTFSYGYCMVGLVFGLLDVSVQKGAIGLIPLLILLVFLLVQLRILFGTSRRSGQAWCCQGAHRSSVDSTYRALCAAEDISI
ncbi:unnamed protein product [Symbiodinium sp. KB8]|nr:unnamed protein product [Symbiodinium sp. KB8]